MTEGRPAGAFWADKIVTHGGVLVLRGGAGSPGGPPPLQHHLNPKLGGQRGEPEALSQPVDPGGLHYYYAYTYYYHYRSHHHYYHYYD